MVKNFIMKTVACMGMFFIMLNGTVFAEGADKTLSPYFIVENSDSALEQFPLKSTDVKVNITGVIADVEIVQTYENMGAIPINAKYIFPASTNAAVHGMKMIIGEEIIVARVQEKKDAQKIFDQAKKKGKSASLLKQHRPNVFSMNVANIMPGDTIEIRLKYTELMVPADNTYGFVYPAVVGPRYAGIDESDASESNGWVKNPYLKKGKDSKTEFNIEVNISSGIPVHELVCSTHRTHIKWENETLANVTLSDPEDFGGDRDFILKYRLTGKKIESGLILYEGEDDEKFFLLMVQPPERMKKSEIPPREYIFVVDISGSMNGFPLDTAKKLLKNLIGGLRQNDLFNVILFAGGSKVLSSSSSLATPSNINKAIRFISNERGGGGTELYSALKMGLALPGRENISRSMIIVTDGYIAAERDVFKLISENLDRTNVFSFGIGSSVNRFLIEGMAKAGQGEPFIVTRPEESLDVAEKFRKYIEAPALTNIKVEYDGFDAYDIEPPSIPDLFAKRPVVVFGKWNGEKIGRIKVTGVGGEGIYHQAFDVSESDDRKTNDALRYLWARNRIHRISDYNINGGGSENRQEVTSLGISYNLLTAYTSFVAVSEKVRNREGEGKDVKQPLVLPRHVSNLAVGGKNVPEPEMWILIVFVGGVGLRVFKKKYRNTLNR